MAGISDDGFARHDQPWRSSVAGCRYLVLGHPWLYRFEPGNFAERLIERLNGYFETIASAIYGSVEILKYIGDAILAIFPVGEEGRHAACLAALAALESAEAGLDRLNRQYIALGEEAYAHGVGLHVGTVSYGNIGSRDRLDFTVIGPAVNLASRIEGKCKDLGEDACAARLLPKRPDERHMLSATLNSKASMRP